HGADCWRHEDAVPAGSLSRYRPEPAAGSGQRRPGRALRVDAAAGHRDSGADGAAGARVVVAMICDRRRIEGPVVFIDKDGTLIDNVPFNVDPERIRLAPGAADGLPKLEAAGYRLAVVSNQSGVARGLFPETALHVVEQRI